MLVVGIDTGTNTGLAMWCTVQKKIVFMQSMAIDEALERISLLDDDISFVFVEDARQRKWYGNRKEAEDKKQGAGYVKAHAVIWEGYLTRKKIPFKMVPPGKTWKNREDEPRDGAQKRFNKIYTKIPKNTHNHHVRDAISLCYKPHRLYCTRK